MLPRTLAIIARGELEKFLFGDDALAVTRRGRFADSTRVPVAPNAHSTARVLGLLAVGVWAIGCAAGPDPLRARNPRELVFAYDDNRATASLTFPNLTYESIVRFELPTGKHRLLRLRLQAQSAGTVAITIYDNSVLECPGEPIHVITREFVASDLSNGKDSRWIVEDLQDLPPLTGTLWIGVRKMGGEPSLWTSTVVSGQSYLRDRDPSRALGLLPVKRTPMLRLEVLP